jgi:hypothetical protein
MKKITLLLSVFLLSFSSCIVVDDDPYSVYYEPCIDYIDYTGYNQVGGTVYIYFNTYCPENKSFRLFIEDPFGSVYINGRNWRPASTTFFSEPIMLQRYSYGVSPNRSYRCIIESSYGYISQEFVVYVY